MGPSGAHRASASRQGGRAQRGDAFKNALDSYTINSITGKKGADGSITVQFGGCDGKIPNCIPIMKGWNYTVRLYRPRPEILSGKLTFPEAQPKS